MSANKQPPGDAEPATEPGPAQSSSVSATARASEAEIDSPSNDIDHVHIFLSYRVNPDQPIAAALKRLIESSIDPAPIVFVSGLGGVRPSAIGFKPQIQKAARQAKAFIGIITLLSKDREWIFYEAGAAWGRQQMYAPLLVGIAPGDLPSSIAEYQAIRGDEQSEVQLLIESLAAELGFEPKPYFGRRFQAFLRAIKSEPVDPEGPTDAPESSSEAFESHVDFAVLQAYGGDRDGARQLLDALRLKASSDHQIALVELARIRAVRPPGTSPLEIIDSLPEVLKSTRPYRQWAAIYEASLRPHIAIDHWEALLAMDLPPSSRAYATVSLAQLHHKTGRELAAWKILRRAFVDSSRELRARAAGSFVELFAETSALERLLVIVASLAIPDEALIKTALELCREERWAALAAFFLKKVAAFEQNAPHHRAMSLEMMDLPSLAYEAYMESVEQGLAVSKVAAASIIGQKAVAAAGLRLMREQVGAVSDAKFPNYPHSVRADLEGRIFAEQERLIELSKVGERFFYGIAEVMSVALQLDSSDLEAGTYLHDGVSYALTPLDDGSYSLTRTGTLAFLDPGKMQKLKLLSGVLVLTRGADTHALLCPRENGDIWGIAFNSLTDPQSCRRVLYVRQPSVTNVEDSAKRL